MYIALYLTYTFSFNFLISLAGFDEKPYGTQLFQSSSSYCYLFNVILLSLLLVLFFINTVIIVCLYNDHIQSL